MNNTDIKIQEGSFSDKTPTRWILRPADEQTKRVNAIMKTGEFKTQSELLRRLIKIGLDVLEKEK